MTQREDVINKVRKLLALSDNNPNKNEAISAALKAQKLIADYDLQASDFMQEVEREPVEVQSPTFHKGRWRGWLASVVAENFRCKVYAQTYRRETMHVFVGYELDAKAALLTYESLAKVGEKLAKDECAMYKAIYGTASGIKNSFLHGFVSGVQSELEKQTQALMLVCPKAVEDYFDNLDLRKKRESSLKIDRDASDSGMRAGRDAVRSRRIGAGDDRLLASA